MKHSTLPLQAVPDVSAADLPKENPAKEYDLGYGFLGNGIMVWNRAEERNGDYVTVAHISTDRIVTFYDEDMPHEVNQRIDTVAKSPDTRVFGFVSAPENIPPRTENAPAPTLVYETVKKAIPELAEPKKPAHDFLFPDPTINKADMRAYGYNGDDMLPLSKSWALQLYDSNTAVYLLYSDNTEAMANDREEIEKHNGIFGIEKEDWEQTPYYAKQLSEVEQKEAQLELQLMHGNGNRFGIYQIRDGINDVRNLRFASIKELEARGSTVARNNYELVYTALFTERIEFLSDRYPALNNIYSTFNTEHPANFTGRSVSVSDVIVLKYNGDISAHYVDSAGFWELDNNAFFG